MNPKLLSLKADMKKNVYWTHIEDDLCKRWVTSTDQREQLDIYRKLYPKLFKMSETIINRYFIGRGGKFYPDFNDHISDSIHFCFVKMNLYNEAKAGKNGWYSFCQTIIKNNYYEILGIMLGRKSTKDVLKNKAVLDYIDADAGFDITSSDTNISVIIDELSQKAVQHFNREKVALQASLALKGHSKYQRELMIKEIEYLRLVMIFLSEFSQFNAVSVNQYVISNAKILLLAGDVFKFTKKHFNINAKLGNNDQKKYEKIVRVQDQYSYVQDDFPRSTDLAMTPKQNKKKAPDKTLTRKILMDEDIARYLYF